MRVSIKTFGCRLNQAESARFAADFLALGWEVAPFGEPVDVVLIHACAVTQTAESEVLRTARKLRQNAFVALTGCVAPAALPRAKEAADLVVADKENVVAQIRRMVSPTRHVTHATSHTNRDGSETTSSFFRAPVFTTSRAWLKVQDGCDCRCSYCIVPDTRGAPRSRPLAECLAEAEALLAAGHRELVVTGCNLSLWRQGNLRLPDLLAKLAAVIPHPSARLRVGSIEPDAAFEREVIDVMAATPALCRFLHFPLQHADPQILRAMRRRHTPDHYRALCEHALAKIPGVALGADVITGFPGETDAAFETLRAFIKNIPFANLHVFPYSERPGTPAATMPDAVPRTLRKSRARELIELGLWQRGAFATKMGGVPQRVLIERVNAAGLGTGWTDTYLPCRVPGLTQAHLNQIVDFTPSKN